MTNLPEELEDVERWRLDLSSDEISSQRQHIALERASAARGDRLAQLRDVLLGHREPQFDDPREESALDAGLNATQRSAVDFALSARDVALIHGPPGTGKTTTVVELIRRAVRRGDKVLACGPSNMAVDNLFSRLLAHGDRAVRLGHPARVMPQLRSHTLDILVERHEGVRWRANWLKTRWHCFAVPVEPRGPSRSLARARNANRGPFSIGRRAAVGGASRGADIGWRRYSLCDRDRAG